MGSPHQGHGVDGGGRSSNEEGDAGSWRLRMDSGFSVPDRFHRQPPFYARIFGGSHGAPHARPPPRSLILSLPPVLVVCFLPAFVFASLFLSVSYIQNIIVSVVAPTRKIHSKGYWNWAHNSPLMVSASINYGID